LNAASDLEKIKRDPLAFVDGHNLAVEQRIDWLPFIGAVGELRHE